MTNQSDRNSGNDLLYLGGFWTLFLLYCAYQIIIFGNWITIVPDERAFMEGLQTLSFLIGLHPHINMEAYFG